jgi:hypothetical protein
LKTNNPIIKTVKRSFTNISIFEIILTLIIFDSRLSIEVMMKKNKKSNQLEPINPRKHHKKFEASTNNRNEKKLK